VRTGEVHRADHVCDAGAANNEVGATVDHRVVDLAGDIITVVTGTEQRAAQTGLELGDRRFARDLAVISCHAVAPQSFDSELVRNAG
jgi:hypothetical protein